MAGTDSSRQPPRTVAEGGGPAVILVEPQLADNIGAAARAMLNFGLTDLRLVRPRPGWPDDKAAAVGAGADMVLERARLYDSTSAAIADLRHVYAATARPRDMIKPVVTPRQAARHMRRWLARGEQAGVLFGPERAGLNNDDVVLAEALIMVPLSPAFASLNLAHAVLLVSYEWFQAGDGTPEVALGAGRSRPATKAELVGLFEHLEAELDAWTHEVDDWSLEVSEGSGAMHPRQMLRALERALPEDAMVTTDIGNICSVANSYLRFEKPKSFFAAMSFGNCGYAFPVAIGAKVAAPGRPAVAYVGDGAWGMSLLETLTCVREDIPVTVVVFNNGQWGAEKKNQVDFYDDRYVGTNLVNPSFAAIARAMGADGIKVTHPGEIGDALRQGTKADKPTVIEVMVTQELGDPFRRDALTKPVRLLPKYKDYTVT
mgnify:CR=1 FL=1